jgi:hypothetical protein
VEVAEAVEVLAGGGPADVVELTLALAREMLAGAGRGDVDPAAALAEAREKRARLEGFYDAAAAGELTPAALARIEARLLPEIEAAESRAQAQITSPLVAEVAGSEARNRWAKLGLPQRREIIATLMVVRILPTVRGSRTFRPESVEIVWRSTRGAEA